MLILCSRTTDRALVINPKKGERYRKENQRKIKHKQEDKCKYPKKQLTEPLEVNQVNPQMPPASPTHRQSAQVKCCNHLSSATSRQPTNCMTASRVCVHFLIPVSSKPFHFPQNKPLTGLMGANVRIAHSSQHWNQ